MIRMTIVDKLIFKYGCFVGSIVNVIRLQIMFNFAINLERGHRTIDRPKKKQFKKSKQSFDELFKVLFGI